jgi:hypothetical protein
LECSNLPTQHLKLCIANVKYIGYSFLLLQRRHGNGGMSQSVQSSNLVDFHQLDKSQLVFAHCQSLGKHTGNKDEVYL